MSSSLRLPFLLALLLLFLLYRVDAAQSYVADGSWSDCSAEMGIDDPSVSFSSVHSVPPIVTKNSSHQIIYKTLTVTNQSALIRIEAQLTQLYKLLDKTWVPFLKTPFLDECTEHDGSQVDSRGVRDGPLCPLLPARNVTIFTVHPPLNKLTPYGLYRSRQVYRDGLTKELVGCVDMHFLYCETDEGLSPRSATCRGKAEDNEEEKVAADDEEAQQ
jgi:hypothetical protein